MKISFDTNDLPAPRRVRRWRGLMCDTYLGLDCNVPQDDFRIVTDGYIAGGHSFTRATSSGHHAHRLATHIRRDGIERTYLGLVLSGSVLMIQGTREARIEPGMIGFNDSSRPFLTLSGPATDVLWIGVPKQPLYDRLGGLDDLTAVALKPSRPVHRNAFDLMTGLDEALVQPRPPDKAEELIASALDLLATTVILSALPPGNIRYGTGDDRGAPARRVFQ